MARQSFSTANTRPLLGMVQNLKAILRLNLGITPMPTLLGEIGKLSLDASKYYEGGEKLMMNMQDEIQQDEILRRAFSKNPSDLNAIEQKAMEEFFQDYLDRVNRFLASRSERSGN